MLLFVAINPKGLVPAIEYKGRALYESLILCEFLEDAFPSHSPSLLPEDPVDRAYARIWMDFVGKSFLPWFMRLLQSQEAEKQKEALQELNKALRTFAQQIKGPYFLGEQFSLVDIAIAPWILRDYIITEHRGFSREAIGREWKEYADLVEKRDSVVRTKSVSVSCSAHRKNAHPFDNRTRSTMQKFMVVICGTKHKARLPKPSAQADLFHEKRKFNIAMLLYL